LQSPKALACARALHAGFCHVVGKTSLANSSVCPSLQIFLRHENDSARLDKRSILDCVVYAGGKSGGKSFALESPAHHISFVIQIILDGNKF